MDAVETIIAVVVAMVAAATFALMIWAAHQVDGHAPAPHRRRRPRLRR